MLPFSLQEGGWAAFSQGGLGSCAQGMSTSSLRSSPGAETEGRRNRNSEGLRVGAEKILCLKGALIKVQSRERGIESHTPKLHEQRRRVSEGKRREGGGL